MTDRLSRDELIERMARAIREHYMKTYNSDRADDGADDAWKRYANYAAAALSVVEKHGLPGE